MGGCTNRNLSAATLDQSLSPHRSACLYGIFSCPLSLFWYDKEKQYTSIYL